MNLDSIDGGETYRMQNYRRHAAITRRRAFVNSGGKCSFPSCETRLWDDFGSSFLHVALINPPTPGGPRYDPNNKLDPFDPSNLIVVCPNHHNIIDRHPDEYTVDRLREMQGKRDREVAGYLDEALRATGSATQVVSPLAAALAAWERLERQNEEEYWQALIGRTPSALLPLLGGRTYTLQGKCYVGGKSFDNKGGNVLDFLAVHPGNVACVEIKTPGTSLMSKRRQYRNNVFLPSDELVGACMQVLENRRSLVENLASLNNAAGPKGRISAPSPSCYVIIGNLAGENLEPRRRHSFELFRASIRDVNVATFDEIFNGLKLLLESMLES